MIQHSPDQAPISLCILMHLNTLLKEGVTHLIPRQMLTMLPWAPFELSKVV